MKYWPAQLLPLALLALLAGLTFWLRQTVENSMPEPPRPPAHDVDATADNFVVRRYDQAGRLKFRLSAPYLKHFADDDSSELRSPVLIAYREGGEAATISADLAEVTSKGEIVQLRDNVSIVRPPVGARPETIARMPDLTVRPDDGTAVTDSAVKITQGQSWATGVGMNYDNNTAILVLRSQVRGQYLRPSPPP